MNLSNLMPGESRKKLSRLLCVTALSTCSVFAYAQQQQVKLTGSNLPLKSVFQQIEKQTDLSIDYRSQDVDDSRIVKQMPKATTVQQAMNQLLAGTDCVVTFSNGHIIIKKQASNTINQQSKRVKGTIVDATGMPVIGANVVVKGTTNGTITDMDGNFSLEADNNATLVVSYIGFANQEIKVGNQTNLSIAMKEDAEALDELVVVGYGVQKKSVVTAAISKVTSEDISSTTPTRIEDVLKGKVSGVQITQNSGQPGAASVVRIRGIGTINNSDPLYIVDGMPVSSGIDYLNPKDIESVEVLKDAASAAIYGARAANGVILVTTKSGKSGKTSVDYSFSYGIQNPWKTRELLNGQQYEEIMNEAYRNAGMEPIYTNPSKVGVGTDWQKLIMNYDAPVINHNANISGGNDKGSYFLSFGYLNQEGIVAKDKSDYKRYNFRLNSNYTIFQTKERNFLTGMRVGVNIGYTKINQEGIDENNNFGGPLFAATLAPSDIPLYETDQTVIDDLSKRYGNQLVTNSEGKLYKIISGSEMSNPVALLQTLNQRKSTDKLVGSIWGELDIIKDLVFKTSYSTDLAFGEETNWRPAYYLSDTQVDNLSRIEGQMTKNNVWSFENTLRYDKSFGKHNFAILLGSTIQKTTYTDIFGKNVNLIADMPEKAYLNFALGTKADQETSGDASEHTLASFFGRINYNYAERYLLEVVLRRDGSSNFPTDHKWAYFPSVSMGWNIHNEAFFPKDIILNQLKFRASWGKNGNEAIDAFQYTSLIRPGANYIFNGETASGMSASKLINTQVRWESSEQYDLGVDTRLFNNTLSASMDWFYKSTNGMLMQLPIPDFIGNTAPDGNVGSMENKGLEMEFSYQNSVSDFNYSFGLNASYMKNKIKDIGVAAGYVDYSTYGTIGVIQRHTTGLPIAHYFGTPAVGIFQNEEQINNYRNEKGELIQPNAKPGDVIFKDVNNDGKIDDNDRTYLGKPNPDWTVGFNLALSYKGFDLSMFWQGVFGNQIFDASRRPDLAHANYSSYILDRWHGEGTSNYYPRVVYANQEQNNNTRASNLYLYNGNYLRLKNLQFGYTLSKKLTQKVYIQNLRLYLMCENLLTFTKYHGSDPEIGNSMGVDKGIYPQARTISLGASVSF